MDGQPSQDATEIMEIDTPQAAKAPEPEVTELPAEKRSLVELSSTTDTESCEAYISRTVELLASVESTATNPNNEFSDEAKASTIAAITPGLNELPLSMKKCLKVSPESCFWISLTTKSSLL